MDIDEVMKKIKLWQEECKLVGLFMAAVTSVWVFVSRLILGEHVRTAEKMRETMKSMIYPEGREVVPQAINAVPVQDWVMVGSLIALVVILPMAAWYVIKVIQKHGKV